MTLETTIQAARPIQNGAVEGRRSFLKSAAATGALGIASPMVLLARSMSVLPQRVLGWTAEKVSAIGLSGLHIGKQRDETAGIEIIRRAIAQGITFMENGGDYGEGAGETCMGKALRNGYRERVFLATQ